MQKPGIITRQQELAIAIRIATNAHHGQFDRQGWPYILHPLAVMNRGQSIEEMIVGVLHDVLEDCDDWTKDRLLEEGISPGCAHSVDLITKKNGIDYDQYIEDLSNDLWARRNKMYDLTENSRLDRMFLPLKEKQIEKKVKYMKSYLYLQQKEFQYLSGV